MLQGQCTIISPDVERALRMDGRLGSSNFLDRCRELHPRRDAEFLFLQRPHEVPGGATYRAFSLDALAEARRNLAAWYAAQGVGHGDVIAVCVTDGIGPFLHYLALTSLGAAGALISPDMSPAMAGAYLGKNALPMLVVDPEVLLGTQLAQTLSETSIPCRVIVLEPSDPVDFSALPSRWPFTPEDSTLVLLGHTSGTTGVPKAVCFEQRQFFLSKRAQIGQYLEGSDERILCALPSSHSFAISHLELAVLHAAPTFVLSERQGEALRLALREFAPTTVLGTPHTYAALAHEGVGLREFASVRRWFSMGDALHRSHVERVFAAAPESRFSNVFGCAELGMPAFRVESTRTSLAPQRSVGRPADDAVAKILDFETGEEVRAGRVGYIALRSPGVAPGYWRQPEATARAWCNGYFLTGDVGYSRQGEFYLLDRAADVITSTPRPLYTLMLEEELQLMVGVSDASVVGTGRDQRDRYGVFALLLLDPAHHARDALLATQAWEVLNAELQGAGVAYPTHQIVVAVAEGSDSFPRGPAGHVLKRQLRQRFRTLSNALAQGQLNSSSSLRCATNGSSVYRPQTLAEPERG